MIAFESSINVNRPQFIAKVKEVSQNLGVDPSWLMVVMYMESKFRRRAYNKTSMATGLFQWIPVYVAKYLKMNPRNKQAIVNKILSMSGVEQLELAEKFLMPYKGRMSNQLQTYLAIFYPAGMGKPLSFEIGRKYDIGIKAKNYAWNSYMDTKFGNNDKILTIADIDAFVRHHVAQDTNKQSTVYKPKPLNEPRKTCPTCRQLLPYV